MNPATALLVIDMQVGNFTGDSPVVNGTALVAQVEYLLERARHAGAAVIFVQHDGPGGGPNEPNSASWAIHPALAPLNGEPVLRKSTPDAFYETGLEELLSGRGVSRLVICGVPTEYCVDTTVRRAHSQAYEVILAGDAHGTWNSRVLTAEQIIAHHNELLGGWFAIVQRATEIVF